MVCLDNTIKNCQIKKLFLQDKFSKVKRLFLTSRETC